MEKKDYMKTVRGFAKAGAVLLRIAQVLAIIGFVGLIIGLVSLAVIPADLVRVTVGTNVKVDVDMTALLSAEEWQRVKDDVRQSIAVDQDEELAVTDTGVTITTDGAAEMTRGDLAFAMMPPLLTLAVLWYFCRELRKALVNIRDGQEPFTRENAGHLKAAGITLLVGAAAPAVASWFIRVFATLREGAGIDLTMAFAGLMLLGLSALFNAVADSRQPVAPPPAFTGYSGYTAAPAPEQTPEQAPEQEPGEAPSSQDDPNAF